MRTEHRATDACDAFDAFDATTSMRALHVDDVRYAMTTSSRNASQHAQSSVLYRLRVLYGGMSQCDAMRHMWSG